VKVIYANLAEIMVGCWAAVNATLTTLSIECLRSLPAFCKII